MMCDTTLIIISDATAAAGLLYNVLLYAEKHVGSDGSRLLHAKNLPQSLRLCMIYYFPDYSAVENEASPADTSVFTSAPVLLARGHGDPVRIKMLFEAKISTRVVDRMHYLVIN